MGRAIPVINETTPDHLLHLLSLSILLTCMAAIIVVSSAMCGTWDRKEEDEDESDAATSNQESATTDILTTGANTPLDSESGEAGPKPLLPPPPAALGAEVTVVDPTKRKKPAIDKSSSLNNYMSKPSRRKLSAGSVSLRMPHAKHHHHHHQHQHHHHHVHVHNIMKPKQEDSLWTKQILRGEKCKVHLDGEAEAVSDKGKEGDSENATEIDEEGLSRSGSSSDASSSGESEDEGGSDVKLDQV